MSQNILTPVVGMEDHEQHVEQCDLSSSTTRDDENNPNQRTEEPDASNTRTLPPRKARDDANVRGFKEISDSPALPQSKKRKSAVDRKDNKKPLSGGSMIAEGDVDVLVPTLDDVAAFDSADLNVTYREVQFRTGDVAQAENLVDALKVTMLAQSRYVVETMLRKQMQQWRDLRNSTLQT